MKTKNEVYSLEQSVAHLENESFEAWIDEYEGDTFEGWENMALAFVLTKAVELPEKIKMHAFFDYLELTDFPICRTNWPVMSKKMVEILKSVGDFKHKIYPITMIDSAVSSKKNSMENNNYVILHLIEHLDIINHEESEYEISNITNRIKSIDKLVLKKPQNGFPPIFRLYGFESELFVADYARNALEKAKIKELEFVGLNKYSF